MRKWKKEELNQFFPEKKNAVSRSNIICNKSQKALNAYYNGVRAALKISDMIVNTSACYKKFIGKIGIDWNFLGQFWELLAK